MNHREQDGMPEIVAIFCLGLFVATVWEASMSESIWKLVRCQRCGALPIDHGKATTNCPVCKHTELGPVAPDYSVPTESDRRFLHSVRIGTTA